MKIKAIRLLLVPATLMLLLVACDGSQPLPDIDITVEARLKERLAAIPTPTARVVEKEVIKEVIVEKIVVVTATSTPISTAAPTATPVLPPRPISDVGTAAPTPTPDGTATSTPTPTPVAGTQIGSMILSQDTIWTVAGSPYHINGTVKIPQGVILTLDPGITVIMSGGTFKLAGSFIATGTEQNPISISGDDRFTNPDVVLFFVPDGGKIRIDHTTIKGIQRLLRGNYAEFEIYDSRLIDLELDKLMSKQPSGDTYTNEQHIYRSTFTMERNIFRNVGTIQSFSSLVLLRFNCFDGQPPMFRQLVSPHRGDYNQINFNSIYGVTTQDIENGSWGRAFSNPSVIITEVIKVGPYNQGTQKDVDGTQNYWDGLTEQDIEKLIYDKNDDIIDEEVTFLPMLDAPHPDTPDCQSGKY